MYVCGGNGNNAGDGYHKSSVAADSPYMTFSAFERAVGHYHAIS